MVSKFYSSGAVSRSLRFILLSCLFSYLSLIANAAAAPLESGQWWRKPFGMLQTNLREIDGDMDVEEVLDFIEDHGAIAWLIGVGGILAQYPTDLDFQTQNPYLERRESGDLISDALNATHARGMRLLGRMDFSKVSAEIANAHPDWLYRSPEGNTQNHTAGLVSVCPSGEYYQERIFDILEEVTSRYKLDGFFVNWAGFNEEDYFKVYHGVCHCENCQRRWQEVNGDLELPAGRDDETYPQWKNFSAAIVKDWTTRLTDFIIEKLPDAGLIQGDGAVMRFHEANNAVNRDMWHFLTSQRVSSYITYQPDIPILVNSVAFVDMPYRMGSEEPAHYKQYFLQTIARGANPSTYIMGTPGKIPYANMAAAKEITTFHKQWRDVYDGMRPIAKTGLVLPSNANLNSTKAEEAESEFRGLYTAMQELHVPFDVVGQNRLAEMAETEGLQRYEVLVLPNLGALQAGEVTALDDWVEAGGRLIATGSSGIGENGTIQLESLPALSVRNTTDERELLWSTYFAPPQENATDVNYYQGPIVPVYGTYHHFEWKEESEGRYKELGRAPFAPPEYAYGNIQNDERGSCVAEHGQGKGVIIPFTIGRGYRELGLSVFRDFYNLIFQEDGAPSSQVTVNVVEQVEMTLNINGPKLVVHLINVSGIRHQNYGSYLPLPGGTIGVNGKNVTAHALRSDSQLEVKDGEIVIPGIDEYEVIVIEGWE